MNRSIFWVWFWESRRWLDATPEGAKRCFLDAGCEVAYGVSKPLRDGMFPGAFPPLLRIATWTAFAIRVERDKMSRHRIATIGPVKE